MNILKQIAYLLILFVLLGVVVFFMFPPAS